MGLPLDPGEYCLIKRAALETAIGLGCGEAYLLMTEAGVEFSRRWFAGGGGKARQFSVLNFQF
jgi:hypothetical protein